MSLPVILILDDIEQCLSTIEAGLKEEFAHRYGYRILTHQILPDAEEDVRTETIPRVKREVANILRENNVKIIVADREIYRQETAQNARGSTSLQLLKDVVVDREIQYRNKFNIEKIFAGPNNCFDLVGNEARSLEYVVIRTYRKDLYLADLIRIERLIRSSISTGVNVEIIETSAGFRVYDLEEQLYQDRGKYYEVNEVTRQVYDENFVHNLIKLLEEEVQELSESNKPTYEEEVIVTTLAIYQAIVKLKTLTRLVPPVSSGLHSEYVFDQELELGHLTLVSDLLNDNRKPEHILDLPIKDYTKQQNTALEAEGWSNIYQDENGKYEFDRWWYVEYSFSGDCFQISNFISDGLSGSKEVRDKILPTLHSTIFYDRGAYVHKCVEGGESGDVGVYFFYTDAKTLSTFDPDLATYNFHVNYTFFKRLGKDHVPLSSKQVAFQSEQIRSHIFYPIADIAVNSLLPVFIAQRRQMYVRHAQLVARYNYAYHHGHTIKNLLPSLSVGVQQALRKLSTYDKQASDKYSKVVTYTNILTLLASISFGVLDNESAFVKRIPNLRKAVRFFVDNNPYSNVTHTFTEGEDLPSWIDETIDYHNIEYEKTESLFLALWNLFQNAQKTTSNKGKLIGMTHYEVSLEGASDGGISLVLKNPPEMPDEYLHYLKDRTGEVVYPGDLERKFNRKKGLEVIKHSLGVLNWEVIFAETADKHTTLKIKLTKI